MRKKNQEITDPKIIEQILSDSTICRVAMMNGNIPYILPFNYGYHDGIIYIHSAPEGTKIDLIKKNRLVCFEMEHTAEIVTGLKACDWATTYRSIVGYGEAEIITEPAQIKAGLEIIMRTNGATGELHFTDQQIARVVIIRITINELTAKQSSNWDKTPH